MDGYEAHISQALRRVTLFTGIVRWVWAINMIAMIVGLVRESYGVAGLAGFSWSVSLTAAAAGRRAIKHLEAISRPSVASRGRMLGLEEKIG